MRFCERAFFINFGLFIAAAASARAFARSAVDDIEEARDPDLERMDFIFKHDFLLTLIPLFIVFWDKFFINPGLKISFTGPSDKMSDDFEFGSDICPMTTVQFGSEISLNDAN